MPTKTATELSRKAHGECALRHSRPRGVADEVARQGNKILYLNIGDPCKYDFPTPPHMIEAVHKAMRDGHNSYAESLGIKPAVDAIRRQAERDGFQNIQSIFVCYGSGEAIDSCLTALINPGDNVLTPSPEYPLYGAVLAKLSATPNAYELDEANGWEPDLADLERKVNSRTKAILLINPNNPTGAVNSRKTLEGIVEIARKHNLLIFADEIYDKLIIDDDAKHVSIATMAPDLPSLRSMDCRRHTWCRDGVLDGALRLGRKRRWRRISKAYTSCCGQGCRRRIHSNWLLRQRSKARRITTWVRSKLRSRRDITAAWAKKTPRVSLVSPKGAFYAHPSLDIPEDDLNFVSDLLRQKHVLVVHGSGFGEKPGRSTCESSSCRKNRYCRRRMTRLVTSCRGAV